MGAGNQIPVPAKATGALKFWAISETHFQPLNSAYFIYKSGKQGNFILLGLSWVILFRHKMTW